MNIFSRIITRFRELLLLILYLVASFLLMINSDSDIVEGLRSTTLFSLGIIQDQIDAIDSYFSLHQKNRQLRQENTRLAYENYRLQNAILENYRLRRMLAFQQQSAFELIPAKVIGFSPQEFVTGFLLSSRDASQIKKNAAVLTPRGLVGKIVKLSSGFAICQSLLDPNSMVSVRIQRNRELGMVAWDGADGLKMLYVSNTVSVLPGDVVYTSGMSQIYPPDIKVGIVISTRKNEHELFQEIRIQPAVNFNSTEEVFIIQKNKGNEPGN